MFSEQNEEEPDKQHVFVLLTAMLLKLVVRSPNMRSKALPSDDVIARDGTASPYLWLAAPYRGPTGHMRN